MKRIHLWLVIILIGLLQNVLVEDVRGDALTESWQVSGVTSSWLAAHDGSPIVVGCESGGNAVFVNSQGLYRGYLHDFFQLIELQTGIEFVYILDDVYSLEKMLQAGDLDMLISDTTASYEDQEWALSESIDKRSNWLCSIESLQSLIDLSQKTIGYVTGDRSIHKFISAYEVDAKIKDYRTIKLAFEAMSRGELHAVYAEDGLALNQALNLFKVKRSLEVYGIESDIRMISRNEARGLIDLVDQNLHQYSNELALLKENSYYEYLRDRLPLDRYELNQLLSTTSIKVGYMQDYIPFDYENNGVKKGISAEILTLLSKVINVPLEYIPYNQYEQMVADFIAGDLNIISTGSVLDPHINDGVIATSVYSQPEVAIASHNNQEMVSHHIFDLSRHKIALMRGSWQEELLKKNKIEYEPVYVNNIREALEKVDIGEADYTIDTYWALSYIVGELNLKRIRVDGELEVYDYKVFLLKEKDQVLSNALDAIIRMINIEAYEEKGLYADYVLDRVYDFYEILTVVLFGLLIFIGIYISFLIKRLNVEKEKAEEANKSKGDFLAKMSHEIRTPLTAIMGYINLLNRSPNIPLKEKEQLKIAQNSSSILLNLVNDILDFSKIDAGKVKLVNEPFNLNLMIHNTVNIIGVMAEEKKLDFNVKLDPKLPKFIQGDERRLEQILINILSNSVKFTKSGYVALTIHHEILRDSLRINYIIKDTGKGMDMHMIDTIFEAFEQEDNSISREYGGSGLGLYIAKDFVKRMGGEIRVESNVGEGTTFYFYTIHQFADPKHDDQKIGQDLTQDVFNGLKVLLVEDNEINQMIIRDILVDLGMRVIITGNGVEALEVANSSFDFILMDIQMPVMNGVMAVKIMKLRDELKNIPIVALTANVMPDQIETYIREGFDAYCSKPIMLGELTQTMLDMYERFHQ